MLKKTLILAGLLILPLSQGKTQSAESKTQDGEKTLYLIATAHLDTQWRWTIRQTIDEYLPNTLRDNFRLFERYPDYVFSFEGAYRYMLAKEYYPEDYSRLKEYVAQNRWRLGGSWVDAVDVNVPSAESLMRHALYGNGYFKKEFRKKSYDVFLPDCFGFGYALPSVAAHCGLKSFSTQKLSWGSAVGVPFDIGLWEGVDGSTLVAAINPGAYVSRIESDISRDTSIIRMIENQEEVSGLAAAVRYFGTGDVGGAPDSGSVAWMEVAMHGDGPVKVAVIGSSEVAGIVPEQLKDRLPCYRGEFLMTRHGVGCYTSQAAMKRWNRKNELLADAAEKAAVTASLLGGFDYPRENLAQNWIRFLWHQFHDDLTGTSIPEAYTYSWNDEIISMNQFAAVLSNAVEATTPLLNTAVEGEPLVVFNPLSIAREDVVTAVVSFPGKSTERVKVFGPGGSEVPSQVVETYVDSLKIIFLARVPSVGYAVYDVRPAEDSGRMVSMLKADNTGLENDYYRVELDDHGNIASIYDKHNQAELLKEPIRLEILYDKPNSWAAWEIDYDEIMAPPTAVVAGQPQIRLVENGPVRVALEIRRRHGGSSFTQTVRLSGGEAGQYVEMPTVIDWYEREALLKASFKFTMANEEVTYDLGLGAVARGVNRPELYEVPGHQWADMTAEDVSCGVAVLNDCRYGWDHPDLHTLRLTLVHTPGVYDNWSWIDDQRSQDNGRHFLNLAVMSHAGDWRQGQIPWTAARFNQPLLVFHTDKHPGSLGRNFSLLEIKDAESEAAVAYPVVAVRALKMAEESDHIIIRLQELYGEKESRLKIRFYRPLQSAREVTGDEEYLADAEVVDGDLLFSIKPFQPKTFAVSLPKKLPADMAPPLCQPLALPFNRDGVSSDGNRSDGDLDGYGNTISGDLLPDTLVYQNVSFVFGPDKDGALNVLDCAGQKLELPGGNYDRLYLLATAVNGPAEDSFRLDKTSVKISLPDYARPIGQWNSRLNGGRFDDTPEHILPAYIIQTPVAWVGTHRHNAADENEAYQFTCLFMVRLDFDKCPSSLTLPNNNRIKIMAATMVKSVYDKVRPAQPLYDVADNTVTYIESDRLAFLDNRTFEITSPIPGARIHYTLDGTRPDATSPLYTRPVTIDKTTTVKTVAFVDGYSHDYVNMAEFTKLVPREPAAVAKPVRGLLCRYYEGEWRRLPNFDSLTAVREDLVDSIAIPAFARDEDYALIFSGFVKIEKEGLYDFFISSDDGSALYIGDKLIADNDGIHGEGEVGGEVALKSGYHPVTAYMFQCKGGKALSVSWAGPDIPRQLLSPKNLYHEGGNSR
ncbi:MAG: glycoside hydrolase family 38 C-terminal domain-containing protein [candidate division Zixibacteria bacterium]|nr:glycoside hydrolase family 38 C-terminal domain-containing protein [candidate division Zixibacteria bacterium]